MTSLDNIFKKIKYQHPPKIDVTDRVMATITEKRFEVVEKQYRPLMLVAAFSSAAAACLALLAVVVTKINQEPLAEIIDQISWVL